jgi:HEAT repeat protein
MHGRLSSLAIWALGCLLLASGCADTAHSINRLVSRPFKKTPEQIYGIKTPRDRVEEFRKVAKSARKLPADKQEQTVAVLTKEFDNDNDGWVRREILKALAQFPQPAAGAVLVRALEDPQGETRAIACESLGVRGDEVAVRELTRVVGSETDDDVRMAAVEALGVAGRKEAIAPLAEALADGDPAMQAEAQKALVSVSGHDYGNNVQAWREYAATGKSDAAEISFAEKMRRALY